MIKNCEYDHVEFDAKRSTAKFCSTNCRVKAAQGIELGPQDLFGSTILGGKARLTPTLVKKAYDRQKNLDAFIKMGVAKVDWISTGISDFDALTQIPRGRITQIQGPYGVGKTTLCLNMIKGLSDKKVLYIDSEASLNPELLANLELDATKFHLYNGSADMEDIVEVIKKAASSGDYEMVIFDSLASTTTKAETEGKLTDRNIGQKAFFTHKMIHMTQMDFKRTNTAFVIINQERDKIGTYYPEKYTPGGNAVPYAASLLIQLKTTKSARYPVAKQGAKRHIYLGHEVTATIIKSKVNNPWRSATFKLHYPNPVETEVIEEAGKPAF